jgi:putative sterol carrier protein
MRIRRLRGASTNCDARQTAGERLISAMKRICFTLMLVVGMSAEAAPATPPPHRGDNTAPQQVFDGMHRSFAANRAHGVHARYQFDLSGPNGGLWWIEVNDGKCKMGRGRIQNPGVTFIASDRDWVALSNGNLSGVWAFMTGRLKIHGDQKLAHKLDELFNY